MLMHFDTTRIARLHAGAAIIAIASAMTASAQTANAKKDEAILLAPVTIYADRQGKSVRDVAAEITVVDGDDIRTRNLGDMKEIVRYVPGVTVSRQTASADPFNTLGGFNIRGVGGNRVQMQVDGSRVAEHIVDGTRDYLDMNFTKQVDIVKGPASVLWGADALGGVVAVRTIDPEDILQGRDRAGIGRLSYDSVNDSAGMSAAFAQRLGSDLSVMAAYARSDANQTEYSKARNDGGTWGCPRNVDHGATPCGELNPTEIASNRFLGKLVWDVNPEHRLKLHIDHLDRQTDVQYDNVLGPVHSGMTGKPTGEFIHNYDRQLETRRSRYALEHSWTPGLAWVDEVRTTLAFTPHLYARTGSRLSTSPKGETILKRDQLDYKEKFLELDIQATSRFDLGSTEHEVTWGFSGDNSTTDYFRQDITRNLTTGDVSTARAGGFNFANTDTRRADIYVQDRITLMDGALELTPGLRYATYKMDPRPDADYDLVAGSEPTVRKDNELLASLGAMYRFGDGWQAWGHYGEGFKMPTAQQLYTSSDGAFFDLLPAPDLRPEYVKSYQLGLRRETARGYVGLTAFKSDYTDFIEGFYNPPGTNDYTYRNLTEVRIWGLELEGEYALRDDLRLTAAASWQRGRQSKGNGVETPHALPPLTGILGVSWNATPDLQIEVVGTFADDVKETTSDAKFKPHGYAVFDVFATHDLGRNAQLNLGIQNIFDRRYFEARAASFDRVPSNSVAASNPIELQTGPGRVFSASLDVKF